MWDKSNVVIRETSILVVICHRTKQILTVVLSRLNIGIKKTFRVEKCATNCPASCGIGFRGHPQSLRFS